MISAIAVFCPACLPLEKYEAATRDDLIGQCGRCGTASGKEGKAPPGWAGVVSRVADRDRVSIHALLCGPCVAAAGFHERKP